MHGTRGPASPRSVAASLGRGPAASTVRPLPLRGLCLATPARFGALPLARPAPASMPDAERHPRVVVQGPATERVMTRHADTHRPVCDQQGHS